jgi:hypothetical protein
VRKYDETGKQVYSPSTDIGIAEQALREIAMMRPLGKQVQWRDTAAFIEKIEAIAIEALAAMGAPLGDL